MENKRNGSRRNKVLGVKFTVSHPLSPTLSPVVNKDITVIFGGTEELLEVQGEAPDQSPIFIQISPFPVLRMLST